MDQAQHHLGHHIKHQQGAAEPFGDPRDQVVNLVALEVREQVLRGDEDRVRCIQLLDPVQVEGRSAMA